MEEEIIGPRRSLIDIIRGFLSEGNSVSDFGETESEENTRRDTERATAFFSPSIYAQPAPRPAPRTAREVMMNIQENEYQEQRRRFQEAFYRQHLRAQQQTELHNCIGPSGGSGGGSRTLTFTSNPSRSTAYDMFEQAARAASENVFDENGERIISNDEDLSLPFYDNTTNIAECKVCKNAVVVKGKERYVGCSQCGEEITVY